MALMNDAVIPTFTAVFVAISKISACFANLIPVSATLGRIIWHQERDRIRIHQAHFRLSHGPKSFSQAISCSLPSIAHLDVLQIPYSQALDNFFLTLVQGVRSRNSQQAGFTTAIRVASECLLF